jgi:3-dehydroquinate synthase
LEVLLDNLIEAGMDRGDHVMALGGGVVGDLAGLAAALLKRGCGWIQVPTTLLAQVDAAVGGKTAINSRHGKNLIGAFHRPAAVLIDP